MLNNHMIVLTFGYSELIFAKKLEFCLSNLLNFGVEFYTFLPKNRKFHKRDFIYVEGSLKEKKQEGESWILKKEDQSGSGGFFSLSRIACTSS